jgi:DNA-binding LacI/PurR family transcriptional regulator
MSRPTIARIAEQAGVSTSAVSYALNGKPGVSPATRTRILALAEELAWEPSATARALAGTAVGSVGLVINRPARLLSFEPFYMEFISGIEEVLGPHGISLVLKVASSAEDERRTYKKWVASRKVDGVIVTDLTENDERPALLREMGIPAVIVTSQHDADSIAVWTDDAGAMREAVRYLAALGHVRIARVSGTPSLVCTQVRTEAMLDEMSSLGLPEPVIVATDFTPEQGAQATRRILSSPGRPTAVIFDSDVMAAVSLRVAAEMGLHVPRDLSIVAWDDSALSRLINPPLTSTSVDVRTQGMKVVQALLDFIDGKAPVSMSTGSLGISVRGTTARAPAAG